MQTSITRHGVYQPRNLSNVADIVFPAVTWGEKYDVGTNGERRLQLYQKFHDALGNNAY
jgi:anaerobic selenocysteine-containing dehydrogenase